MMDESSPKSPAELPQSTHSWYFAYKRMRSWLQEDDGDIVRPWLMIIMESASGFILNVQIGLEPSPQEALGLLHATMLHPTESANLQPHRPAQILFEDRELANTLRDEMAQIDVVVKHRSRSKFLNQIVREVEEQMRGDEPRLTGLLSQRKVTPKILSGLFSAAAEFYREQPWVMLSNQDILAVKAPPAKKHYYVTVMGQGGVEYGLSLYKSREALEQMYSIYDDVMETIPEEGACSITYGEIYDLPFDDIDAIERYGWDVVGPMAYPLPLVYLPSGELERPSREELVWFEAALRAIPIFVRDHLRLDEEGDLVPAETGVAVTTSSGRVTVEIKYPVEGLPEDWGLVPMMGEGIPGDLEDMPHVPDQRALEGDMARILSEIDDEDADPKRREAQDLMYQAWDEPNPAKRINMAHRALRISPDCADAYVLLAEEEAGDPQRALDYYQKGLKAGERALGEGYFEEHEGYFWGLLETRPYMRARAGLAGLLWHMGRKREALNHYREMLRLNPGDNQGIRYQLVDLLLSMNREDELEDLLDQYEGEWSSVWMYTRALVTFRKAGASKEANLALTQALEQNPYVPAYLTGEERVPNRLPAYIGIGDEREAVTYGSDHLNHWRRVPGAVEWLQERLVELDFKPPESDEESVSFSWAYFGEQGQRIQEVLEGVDEEQAFEAWHDHLRKRLKFPFKAEFQEIDVSGPMKYGDVVKALELKGIDDQFGIMVTVLFKDGRYIVPLSELEITKSGASNYQTLDDYLTWYEVS